MEPVVNYCLVNTANSTQIVDRFQICGTFQESRAADMSAKGSLTRSRSALGTEDGRRSPTLSVSFVKTQARQGASLSDLRAIRAYQARNRRSCRAEIPKRNRGAWDIHDKCETGLASTPSASIARLNKPGSDDDPRQRRRSVTPSFAHSQAKS